MQNVVHVLRVLVVAGAFGFVAGCASAGGAAPTPAQMPSGKADPPIADTWRARCGACHRRVEPGTRSRVHLEEALSRHRKRARLSEEEWRELIDFLAAPTT